MVKILSVNAGDVREMGLIPGSGRSSGGGRDSPLHDFCLQSHGQRTAAGYSP